MASYVECNMDLVKRTSNTKSASIGMPYLNPNDITFTRNACSFQLKIGEQFFHVILSVLNPMYQAQC